MVHNSEDRLQLKLSEQQRDRAEKIREEIYKRSIRPEWSEFTTKEQHAIEIFLRSECKDLTSSIPNLKGKFTDQSGLGGVHFKPRRDFDEKRKQKGGSKLPYIIKQVVEHPNRITRCQDLKNSVKWTTPFDYSTLVANANAVSNEDPKKSRRRAWQREYTYKKRRQQGVPIKNPSGSPYASEDESDTERPRAARRRQNVQSLNINLAAAAAQRQTQNNLAYLQSLNINFEAAAAAAAAEAVAWNGDSLPPYYQHQNTTRQNTTPNRFSFSSLGFDDVLPSDSMLQQVATQKNSNLNSLNTNVRRIAQQRPLTRANFAHNSTARQSSPRSSRQSSPRSSRQTSPRSSRQTPAASSPSSMGSLQRGLGLQGVWNRLQKK
jgi:hypothetical protein